MATHPAEWPLDTADALMESADRAALLELLSSTEGVHLCDLSRRERRELAKSLCRALCLSLPARADSWWADAALEWLGAGRRRLAWLADGGVFECEYYAYEG